MRSLLPMKTLFFGVAVSCLLGGLAGRGPWTQSALRSSPKSSREEMEALRLLDSGSRDGGLRASRTEIYVPMRRCHVILKDKVGEFSIPVMRSPFPRNIRCNWTIWTGHQSHVIVYVHGFVGNGDCEANSDQLMFQGISSVAESSTVRACSNRRVHVYATRAVAVHVVLLSKNYAPGRRYRHFKGKYYIFREPRTNPGARVSQVIKLPVLSERTSKPTISSMDLRSQLWMTSASDSVEKWSSPGVERPLPVTPSLQFQGLPMGDGEKRLWISASFVSHLVPPSSLDVVTKTPADDILASTLLQTSAKDLWKASFPSPAETADNRWTETLEKSAFAWLSASGEGLSSTVTSISSSMVALEWAPWPSLAEWQRPESASEDGLARPTLMDADLGSWERATSWTLESVSLRPSQVIENISGADKQQTGVFADDTPTLLWKEPDAGLTAEFSLSPEGCLSQSVPVTELICISSSFLPVPQTESSPAKPFWETVAVSEDTLSSTIKGLAWTDATNYAGDTLAAYPSGGVAIPPTLSSHLQVAVSESESLFLHWLALSSSLLESETAILTHSTSSHSVSSWFHTQSSSLNLSPQLHASPAGRDSPHTAWGPEGLATEPLESLTRVKPTTALRQTPLAPAAHESIPQSASVFLPSACHSRPRTSEGTMGRSAQTSKLDSGLQLSSGILSETRGEVESLLSSPSPATLLRLFSSQGKSAEHPWSCGPDFPLCPLVTLTPSLSLTGLEFASERLVGASQPEPKEAVPSRTMAPVQPLGLSEKLLLVTSDSREHIGTTSLLEGRRDSVLHPVPSEAVPGFWLSDDWSSSPESASPSETQAYATVAASLAPELHRPRTAVSSEETTGEHADMIIQPSRKITSKEAKPWLATRSLGQVWTSSIHHLPAAFSSLPRTSGEQTQTVGAPCPPSAWEDSRLSMETELPQNHTDMGQSTRVLYAPVRGCHVVLKDTSGTFSLPPNLPSHLPNIWCNWTIWAGPKRHVVIYIQGFGGRGDCVDSQDRILFQPFSSSAEKPVCACRHSGTLHFAAQAPAVHVVLLSMRLTRRPTDSTFQGQFYVFAEPEGHSSMSPGREVPVTLLPSKWLLETISSASVPSVGLGNTRAEAKGPSEVEIGEAPSQEPCFPFLLLPDTEEDPVFVDENPTSLMQLSERWDGVGSVTTATTFWNSQAEQKPALDSSVVSHPLPASSVRPPMSCLSLTSKVGSELQSRDPFEGTDRELAQVAARQTRGGHLCTLTATWESSSHQEDLLDLKTTQGVRIGPRPTQDLRPDHGRWVQLSSLNGTGHQVVTWPYGLPTGVTDNPPAVGDHTLIPPPELWEAQEAGLSARVLPLLAGILRNSPDAIVLSTSDVTIFSSLPGNGSVLTFHHSPEDFLVKVTIESGHLKELLSGNSSTVLRFVMRETKQEISEEKEHFPPQYEETRKTGVEKKDAVNVTYAFWLHLRSQGVGVQDTLSFQLRTLIKNALETHEVEKRYPSFEDVNECDVGLELCGDGAECVNSAGSYSCHCGNGYEDNDPVRPGMQCAHLPLTGVQLSFSSVDLLVGVSAFFAALSMLAIGLVWFVTRVLTK